MHVNSQVVTFIFNFISRVIYAHTFHCHHGDFDTSAFSTWYFDYHPHVIIFIILSFNSNVVLKRQLPSNYMDCFSIIMLQSRSLQPDQSSLITLPSTRSSSLIRTRSRSLVNWSVGSSSRQSTETCWSSSSSPSTSQSTPHPLTTCAYDARCDLDVELDFVHILHSTFISWQFITA